MIVIGALRTPRRFRRHTGGYWRRAPSIVEGCAAPKGKAFFRKRHGCFNLHTGQELLKRRSSLASLTSVRKRRCVLRSYGTGFRSCVPCCFPYVPLPPRLMNTLGLANFWRRNERRSRLPAARALSANWVACGTCKPIHI